jgi:hypothetical protein
LIALSASPGIGLLLDAVKSTRIGLYTNRRFMFAATCGATRIVGAPFGAPTIALKTANIPLPGTGAPTIALKTANTPLPAGGAATVSLPKATVALNPPTKPLNPISGASSQKPTVFTAEEDEDESGAGTFAKVLAGVGLVAALVVLGVQLKISSIWIGAEDNDRKGEWSLLLE